MTKRIWRDLLLLIGIFVIIWLIFAKLPIFPKNEQFMLTAEKEQAVGEKMVTSLLLHTPGVDSLVNDTVNLLIDSIYCRLYGSMTENTYAYRFIVIKNNQINAFALPGGYIILYTGLIQFCDSPEELASVIAHEIGHIEKRHVVNRLIKKLGLTILLSGDASVISELSQTAISTVFDRQQEREADEFAQQLLEKSNISPRIIATFFRKLENEGLSYNKNFELLATHPHHDERIKSALSYVMDSTFKTSVFNINMQNVKAELAKQ